MHAAHGGTTIVYHDGRDAGDVVETSSMLFVTGAARNTRAIRRTTKTRFDQDSAGAIRTLHAGDSFSFQPFEQVTSNLLALRAPFHFIRGLFEQNTRAKMEKTESGRRCEINGNNDRISARYRSRYLYFHPLPSLVAFVRGQIG